MDHQTQHVLAIVGCVCVVLVVWAFGGKIRHFFVLLDCVDVYINNGVCTKQIPVLDMLRLRSRPWCLRFWCATTRREHIGHFTHHKK